MTDSPSTENAGTGSAFARFGPLAIILVAAGLFFLSGAHRYLSFEALKNNYEALQAFVDDNFGLALFLYCAVYITVTALSLPGATLMSLAGGFLFGVPVGLVAVVLSATVGATIIYQIARTALGDSLRKRAGGMVKKLENGFNENAFSYLLLLRLIPLFPFFVVNIAPAIFGVKTHTFFLATLIGIIPGAFAFVSAGNGLGVVLEAGGEIKLSGLLTQPEIITPIIALSVLALIPILYQRFKGAKKDSKGSAA